MTYEDLLVQLLTLETSQLKKSVTVFDTDNEEYYPLQPEIAFSTEECDALDVNTPVLYL
jgi:hypothetical protein